MRCGVWIFFSVTTCSSAALSIAKDASLFCYYWFSVMLQVDEVV